jgi:hypothetical protein
MTNGDETWEKSHQEARKYQQGSKWPARLGHPCARLVVAPDDPGLIPGAALSSSPVD